MVDAQAIVDAAAGKATAQKDKAALAQKAAKFEADAFAARDAIIDGPCPLPPATLLPSDMVPPADAQATVIASPVRTQRPLGGLLPSGSWFYTSSLPSCLGGANSVQAN